MKHTALIYNGSLLTGLGLVGAGVWQFSHGAAFAVVGGLVLAFTVYNAERTIFRRGAN